MPKRAVTTNLLTGFPPIATVDARVLVLGSMPSVASLAKRQYYGHPQNAFWRIMDSLFDAGLDRPYAERCQVLKRRGVAVWDVLHACRRAGSLDSSIHRDSEAANDFLRFFRRHRRIRCVFFNGTKAETAYRRHVLKEVGLLGHELQYERLPSTSPAHAGRSFAEKLRAWQAVRVATEPVDN